MRHSSVVLLLFKCIGNRSAYGTTANHDSVISRALSDSAFIYTHAADIVVVLKTFFKAAIHGKIGGAKKRPSVPVYSRRKGARRRRAHPGSAGEVI